MGAAVEWVRLWNSRGYAALAIDTCGALGDFPPERPDAPDRERHAHSGPPGWGGFEQMTELVSDHWIHHAVAAVIRGVSMLRSKPRVLPDAIGITGVSWGGFLTCLVAGLDSRLACAMPVYGCGFVSEESVWQSNFSAMGPEPSARWAQQFDPGNYLAHARMPMLWLNGTNDFAYWPSVWQRSASAAPGPRTMCLKLRMPHGHGGDGENAPELAACADAILRGGPGLARITGQGLDRSGSGLQTWATVVSAFTIRHPQLLFTRDTCAWPERTWHLESAHMSTDRKRMSATVPTDATAWCLQCTDYRGLLVTSDVQFLPMSGA